MEHLASPHNSHKTWNFWWNNACLQKISGCLKSSNDEVYYAPKSVDPNVERDPLLQVCSSILQALFISSLLLPLCLRQWRLKMCVVPSLCKYPSWVLVESGTMVFSSLNTTAVKIISCIKNKIGIYGILMVLCWQVCFIYTKKISFIRESLQLCIPHLHYAWLP